MKPTWIVSIAFFLTTVIHPALARDVLYGDFSPDSLIAGQSNEMLIKDPMPDSSYQLSAELTPRGYVWDADWPYYEEDTLRGKQVHKFDDSTWSVTFDIPLGTYPTEYTLSIWDSTSYQFSLNYDHVWIVSPPYITQQPVSVTACPDGNASFEVSAYQQQGVIVELWYHNDQPLINEGSKRLSLYHVSKEDTGYYYCILTNNRGSVSSDTVRLDLYPIPESVGTPEGPQLFCQGENESTYQVEDNPDINEWNWVLIPEIAGTMDQQDNEVTVQWDGTFRGTAKLVAQTVAGQCPGPVSDTLEIKVTGPDKIPDICIVGLDEDIGKYRIVWNKLDDESIVAYNIYRESNEAGVYLLLETVPADEFSVYVDSLSVPESVAHSYKLSYTDSCGLESEFSTIHSTIHLSANVSTSGTNNLIWSPYQGFAFLTYRILRGTDEDSLEDLQEVSSNVTSYTDADPPGGKVYYQIVVSRGDACNPSEKSDDDYGTTKSNIIEFEGSGIDTRVAAGGFDLYPNPAGNLVEVTLAFQPDEKTVISVFDLAGKVVSSFRPVEKKFTIPTEKLEEGIYFIRLEGENRPGTVRKLVIQR